MARFDVYRSSGTGGYLLDCQADVLSQLGTRLIVPLLPPDEGPPVIPHLNPAFRIEGERVIMYTQYATAVSRSELGGRVASLADEDAAIMNALDMLLTGY
jgi:toxin CcdB